ncbi:MAG TPA: MerR family transcriptional regulator [bacterium]|nr:MerR family transcriptional regulator [bacterium]
MKTSDDLPIYPIRTVASLSGVDARRLRSWEVEYQLLRPARTKGGHRLYSTRDLRMVQAIRRLVEEEGMSLQGVRAWLAAQPDQGEAEGASSARSRTPEPAGAGGATPAGRRGE